MKKKLKTHFYNCTVPYLKLCKLASYCPYHIVSRQSGYVSVAIELSSYVHITRCNNGISKCVVMKGLPLCKVV